MGSLSISVFFQFFIVISSILFRVRIINYFGCYLLHCALSCSWMCSNILIPFIIMRDNCLGIVIGNIISSVDRIEGVGIERLIPILNWFLVQKGIFATSILRIGAGRFGVLCFRGGQSKSLVTWCSSNLWRFFKRNFRFVIVPFVFMFRPSTGIVFHNSWVIEAQLPTTGHCKKNYTVKDNTFLLTK